ncbi:unnamed protein product [Rotaria magnacalcarata]|uniref:Protein AF-10 n=2 Tax=Rotaria magnacalcarata TaxID=392030 RepID=A0A817A297_9BILA|nr:unnamed protein product [Rotaria magnacalcarata]CAF2238702.1 unnamed protein product [Rotaria magnacalcarata]CAF3751078.1 unnamed protein product [Rotaria magnacalcarata]CAF4071999.1 unnamed protein product [Rotaria magnacalcarata]
MTNHEELVGGCCVCSDDQGFSNNALVYCDGKDCTVACHTACYGIVSIPDDNWYCRRCELGEFHAPCRLCPLIEGAMKRTSDGHWAHVICALYIPEVSFGNDATMEPIILSKIPSIRFGQTCSICIKNGRSESDASKGACCECTVKNCSQLFHVTCAQQAGLLYEDIRKNNCQYPIYCESHQPRFSKFIRQIPSFQYYSSEKNQNSKQKETPFKSSHCASSTHTRANGLLSSSERYRKSKNETSQNSSKVNLQHTTSPVVELHRQGRISRLSTSQNQSIIDTRKDSTTVNSILSNVHNDQQSLTLSIYTSNTSKDNKISSTKETFTPKIKIEANEIDYQIIEQINLNKDTQLNKKRHNSNEDGPRPVGRPPSKKTHFSQSKKTTNHSIPVEQHRKTVEHQTKNDQTNTNVNSGSSLINSSITSKPIEPSLPPQTLEEFLEQEWESTSDFLLQQNMPQDVSSLLSCLYQFKSENASLKKQLDELKHRRDSLRVINVNLRRKLSETLAINNTLNESSGPPINNQKVRDRNKSPIHENQTKSSKNIPSGMEFISNNLIVPSSFSYQPMHPYVANKNEQLSLSHGLSLELLSQVLTNTGPQLFAPTWNISNFGYANFPGVSSISVSDESILRSYPPFP